MAIYELEPAHKIGPIKWGVKLGKRIDQCDAGFSVEEKKWAEGEGSGFVAEKRDKWGFVTRWRKIPLNWWDHSGSFVTPKGGDAVQVTAWADNDAYGYVQTTQGLLKGSEINDHPFVGRKFRFIPD